MKEPVSISQLLVYRIRHKPTSASAHKRFGQQVWDKSVWIEGTLKLILPVSACSSISRCFSFSSVGRQHGTLVWLIWGWWRRVAANVLKTLLLQTKQAWNISGFRPNMPHTRIFEDLRSNDRNSCEDKSLFLFLFLCPSLCPQWHWRIDPAVKNYALGKSFSLNAAAKQLHGLGGLASWNTWQRGVTLHILYF